MDIDQQQLLGNNLGSDPEITAEMSSIPRVVTSAQGVKRLNHLIQMDSQGEYEYPVASSQLNVIQDENALQSLKSHMSDQQNIAELSNEQLTSRVVAQPQKVLMQINKYVHPCERLPHFVKAEDLAEFALEYDKKENERIKDHLQTFDELVTQTLCGSQDGLQSRIKRFQNEYLPESGCDEEREELLSYAMFIDDVKGIRNLLITFLHDTLSGQLTAEKKFAKEREFFSD